MNFNMQGMEKTIPEVYSMLTLAGAMVHPSFGKLEKPQYTFHRYAWQRNVLDIDHIHYAAMDSISTRVG